MQAGDTGGVFSNSLHGSERAVTSGELFLCTLQKYMSPEWTEAPKFLVFTDGETHSKCSQGETFAKVDFFLPLFSAHP